MNRTTFTAEPGKQQVVMAREFDAPRALVFRAFTDPKWYVRWFGPRQVTMTLEKFEPKSGGTWRYIHQGQEGPAYAFHGVFHEVLPPKRLIETVEFEGLPESGHVTLHTIKFEELPGSRTRVTTQVLFQSVADRDQIIQFRMEQGYSESYSRLDELLAEAVKGQRGNAKGGNRSRA